MNTSAAVSDCIELERVDDLRTLLEEGASPNVSDPTRYDTSFLPIFHAIDVLNQARINGYSYNLEILELLLAHGASVDVRFRGETAREMAVDFEFSEAVSLIDALQSER